MRSLIDRLGALPGRLSYRRLSPRGRRFATLVSLAVFAVVTFVALARFEPGPGGLSIASAVAVVATAPIPLLLSGLEFSITGSMLGLRVDRREALRIAVLGYGLNYLPLPGGTMLRISALTDDTRAHSLAKSTGATLVVGGFWLSAALLLAAVAALSLGVLAVGWVLLGSSVVAGVVATATFNRIRNTAHPNRLLVTLLAVEISFVAVAAARTYLALAALGVSESGWEAAGMVAAASAVSTAMGLFPAGLGIREVLAGALAGAAGIEPASGVLVTGLLRIAGASAAGLIALIHLLQDRPSRTAQ